MLILSKAPNEGRGAVKTVRKRRAHEGFLLVHKRIR